VSGAGDHEVVALVGNPRPASRTATAATQVARLVVDHAAAPAATVIDLATEPSPLGADAPQRLAERLEQVTQTRYLIVASPTYKASYTGLLKSFLDLIPSDGLRATVAIPLMTMGGPAHALVADVHLRPVLLELGASLPTSAVVLSETELVDLDRAVAAWWSRARDEL
jgi:FMN reductase